MPPSVAVFTDTYLPTVNGVAYTVQCWRERWAARGGRMAVVFPGDDDYSPAAWEYPVDSVDFPFYEGFKIAAPSVPGPVERIQTDLVHAHTPFMLGLSGYWLAQQADVPLVASYHTPTPEYAGYLAGGPAGRVVERAAARYEQWFLSKADVILTPSEPTRRHLREQGVGTPVEVVPNGVDLDRFGPVEADAFTREYDLDTDKPVVGYTGRHGHEKQLDVLIEAVDGLDVTLVFGGDGPAREELERLAAGADVDCRFLGMLDRDELPAFYSALDVFGFPSPVETQGLVALEAIACGTPVAAVDAGGLVDAVENGETGYRARPGDPAALRATVERTLAERDRLADRCLDRRDDIGVATALDELQDVYASLL